MRRLKDRIAGSEVRARLPQTEAKMAEEALALTDAQVDVELTVDIGGEGLAVPQGPGEADVLRGSSEDCLDRPHLGLRQPTRAPGAIPLSEPRLSLLV